jgi:hypothetical protein
MMRMTKIYDPAPVTPGHIDSNSNSELPDKSSDAGKTMAPISATEYKTRAPYPKEESDKDGNAPPSCNLP